MVQSFPPTFPSSTFNRKMSSITESSPIDSILALVAELSFADKLVLNERLSTVLRKEGKSGKIGKAAKPKNAKDKPKREAAVGTLAWIAFVKHCKTEFTDRFEGITLEKERLAIAKQLREEDKDAYNTFVADYKAKNGAPSSTDDASDGEEEAPSSPVVVAPKLSAAEKVAAMKAKAASSSAPAKTAAVPAKKAAAPVAAPVVSAAPAKKEVKKAAAAKKPAAVAKKVSKKEEVVEEEGMPTKTIDDSIYFFDADTNGLWMREDDGGFGAWVGYFQDGNTDEPIRFTEAPEA